MTQTRPTILHSLRRWLPLTESWILSQYDHLRSFEQHIAADELTENAPEAPNKHIAADFSAERINRYRIRSARKLSNYDLFRRRVVKALPGEVILYSHNGTRGYHDLNLKPHKHVVRYYGFDLVRMPRINPEWRKRYLKLFEQADRFIVEGEHMKKLLTDLQCPADKISISYFAVDAHNIDYRIREFDHPDLHVFMGPSFREKKGIVYAMEAVGRLIRDFRLNLRVHLIGGADNEDPGQLTYMSQIRNVIDKYKLQPFVKIYGYVSHESLLKIALDCDFALHPSVFAEDGDCEGGYPVTILELMATGLPVIATDHCDIPFVVNDQNGALCRERNVEDIVSGVIGLLRGNTLKDKSEAARRTATERITYDGMGRSLRAIFDDLSR